MLLQRYEFRGLNLRQKDLGKNPLYSSDLQNVRLDAQRNLIKRYGYSAYNSLTNVIQLIPYVEQNTLLAVTSDADALYKLNTSTDTWEKVNFMGSGTAPTYSEPVSFLEQKGNIYFSDPAEINFVMKFDGYRWHRAGVPQPSSLTLISGGGGGTLYGRFAYQLFDLQGNRIFGDILSYTGNDGDTLKVITDNLQSGGYYFKWLEQDGSATPITSVKDSVAVLSHNYVAGDWVRSRVEDSSTSDFIRHEPVKIVSVTATSITVDNSVLNSGEEINDVFLDDTIGLAQFSSTNQTFGYVAESRSFIAPFVDMEWDTIPFSNTQTTAAETVYDFSVVKQPPPRCKYITEYNGVVVLGNYVEVETSGLIADTKSDSRDTIFWSDLSVGGSVESFPPFNYEILGKTSEGGITGLFGGEDVLTVLKEKNVYSLTGVLTLREYRIRNHLTNGNGCVSHSSIIELSGKCLFQSQSGIYSAGQGDTPEEISDLIEPLFTEDTTGLDFTKTVGLNDSERESIYFFIPATNPSDSIVLLYDYYHGEWFKWKGIDASGGFVLFGGDIYHANGSNVFKESTSYNDAGSAIEAYYATSWDDGGSPSLKKKFVKVVAFALSSLSYVLSITSQKDWTDTDLHTETIQFPQADKQEDRKFSAVQGKSYRFIFKNDVLDEGFFLSGYEVEAEGMQTIPRGD